MFDQRAKLSFDKANRKGDHRNGMRSHLKVHTNRANQWFRLRPTLLLIFISIVVFAWPSVGTAAEIRKGDRVEIGANETIDDTLIVVADTVVVEGQVNGDLIAAARVLRITGDVQGSLFAAGEQVDLEGKVGRNVIGAASTFTVIGTIKAQMYAAASNLVLRRESSVQQDLMAAASKLDIAGNVGRDAYAAIGQITLDGSTSRDLVVATGNLSIRENAIVGRNLKARVSDLKRVDIAENSTIGGQKEIKIVETDPNPSGRFIGSFIWRLLMATGGFVLGIVLYTFAPKTFQTLPPQKLWLRTIAIGFIALIAIPFASIISAATLVGIPLAAAAMTVFFWSSWIGLLVVAAEIGRRALRRAASENGLNRSEFAWSLGLGLLILTLVTSIPIIGGFAQFLVTLVGLGIMLPYFKQRWMQRSN